MNNQQNIIQKKLMTRREAASYLGVKEQTLAEVSSTLGLVSLAEPMFHNWCF